ncbi:MAG: VOC family protein [Actinomycetota bacterium]|nr:VOC family protein [Actinomycetota bacterium]
MVNPIPEGYPRVTPYICVDGAAAAIDFYTRVFGATERTRMPAPGGKIGHAEITLGDSLIMLTDEAPEMGVQSPKAYGGSPVSLHLYVEDVDDVFTRAVEAGGKAVTEPQDHFYGDRSGTLEDPFGHIWYVSTRIEDVAPEEMARRAEQASQGSA